MKIIIAPDSFKGSLESEKISKIISHAAKKYIKDVDIIEMPIADGGEGTTSVLVNAMNGYIEKTIVEGPFGKDAKVNIGFINGVSSAIIETAQAAGHHYAGSRLNPLRASTYGVGQMISYATSKGAKKIYLTLGGSCTNDCGAGMLSAMGISFVDMVGNHFTPVGGSLDRVVSIEYEQRFAKYQDVEFVLLCDVTNPLLGDKGCAKIYAPQKGADEKMVIKLENADRHFADVVRRVTGKDVRNFPGAGAAGGIGFGAMSFLNSTIMSGADAVLNAYDFKNKINDADLIITGEGSFDYQSVMGKAIAKIFEYRCNKPVTIFCGISDGTSVPSNCKVITISDGYSVEESISNASELLRIKAEEYFSNINKKA